MGGPFYIYRGDQWAEVDVESGKVSGGGRAKFFIVRDGKLVLVKARDVLAGLRALAAGRRSAVRLGMKLPERRRRSHKRQRRRRLHAAPPCAHAHCCGAHAHAHAYAPTRAPTPIWKPQTSEQNNNQQKPEAKAPAASQLDFDSSSSEAPCKELFIDYQDIEYLKRVAVEHPEYCGKVDGRLYDEDPTYRNKILFKFIPLVKMTKNPTIDKMAIDQLDNMSNMSLEEFAKTLGLRHVDDIQTHRRYKTRLSKNEKENVPKDREVISVSETDSSEGKRQASSDDDVFVKKVLKPKVVGNKIENKVTRVEKKVNKAKPVKSKSASKRDYSPLEDHAIVSWLSAGGARTRRVNGNKVWRELQAQYKAITSIDRSWHSLRNRYLRHILPSLGGLCLPPAQTSRLRADAARGELKLARKKSLDRRNSIFDTKRVASASAWVTRSRGAKEATEAKNDSKAREGAKDVAGAKNDARTKNDTGAKSDPKAREGATGVKSDSKAKEVAGDKQVKNVAGGKSEREKIEKERVRTRLSGDKHMMKQFQNGEDAPRSPPTYASLTRDFVRRRRARLSTDTKSTPSPPPETSEPSEPQGKKRRLFNPHALNAPTAPAAPTAPVPDAPAGVRTRGSLGVKE